MLALMEMTNPMWEWLIAPLALMTIGLLIGYFAGRWEKDTEALERLDHQDPYFSAPLRMLPAEDNRPYDEQAERERRIIDAIREAGDYE